MTLMENTTAKTDAQGARDQIDTYFNEQSELTLLRFITCGSVDDGKSTLIGRLLLESKQIFDDQLAAVQSASRVHGTQGAEIDLALLVDGLASEREQGITIDVAYRFFATSKRKFIVADTPGHEQYTRNMATGASTADLAVILVDARHGLMTQTRRHSQIVSLMGTGHVVLAVNKMDLVDWSEERFREIEEEYREFAVQLGPFKSVTAIPVSALTGDNVTSQSESMTWFNGPSLIEQLETVEVAPFRLPVQFVRRPSLDFRGYSGRIAGGEVRPGDEIRVVPSGQTAKVSRIVLGDTDLESAGTGRSVTLTLDREIDISRGNTICGKADPATAADQFEVTLLWMDEAEMLPGRRYLLKCGTQSVPASVTRIKHKIDVNTFAELAAEKLDMNEIGECNISVEKPIVFDPYLQNRETGAFILIDRVTNATVGLGMIRFALRRSTNIHLQSTKIGQNERTELKRHEPSVLWFTGLSGAGKSTIADIVEQRLVERCIHTMLLDGDNVRHGLNRDLGFTDADRVENIRRIAEVSSLMFEAGVVTLVSFISPFRSERRLARRAIETKEGGEGRFLEVYVATPLEEAERRDVKGLYAKARAGDIKNFTGIDSPYEEPEDPELVLDTTAMSALEAADKVIADLVKRGII
jgi:bifunctional enzyme CysN/CysC